MRIPSSYSVPPPARDPGEGLQLVPLSAPAQPRAEGATGAAATAPTAGAAQRSGRFSVLNDFRYLTDDDKTMLADVTGESIEPGYTDRAGANSAFALQLALDRRTGQLAPNQPLTSLYLRNAAADIDQRLAGRAGAKNPYSGEILDKAVDWLDRHGRGRADLRL